MNRFLFISFEGKLRVGTRIFQNPGPNQTRISLSQIANFNEDTFGYVSNSLSCSAESQDDQETDAVTTRTTKREKKNYQYQGNFGFKITQLAGDEGKCKKRSKNENREKTSKSTTSRKFGKKSTFNKKNKPFNRDGKPPRGCSDICPMCHRPWNLDKYEKPDDEISADEFVCEKF